MPAAFDNPTSDGPALDAAGPVRDGRAHLRAATYDATGATVAGYYSVDLDRLPRLRTDLEGVRAEYDAAYEVSVGLRHITAPGLDETSLRVAAAYGRMSGEEPGQLGWCAKEASNEISRMIGEIDAILLAYRDAEDANELRA